MTAGTHRAGDRLRSFREKCGMTQPMIAEKCGVSLRALQDYEAGKRLPAGEALEALGGMGLDLNWLLTGDGEMFRDTLGRPVGGTAAQPAIDAELMGLIVEGISGAYKDEGAALAPRLLGELATRLHTDILASVEGGDDPGARRAALRALLIQLRRDLHL